MSQVLRRPAASRDLVTTFRRYAREAGVRVADRSFVEAEATFTLRAGTPGIGTPYEPDEPLYAGLRDFPVSRFRAYLVFDRPIPGGIEVSRALHRARDIQGALADGFGLGEGAVRMRWKTSARDRLMDPPAEDYPVSR